MRLVREENSQRCHLVVQGSETEIAIYALPNVAECMKRQADIEGSLQAAGYQLDTITISSDRRSKLLIRRDFDHRGAAR